LDNILPQIAKGTFTLDKELEDAANKYGDNQFYHRIRVDAFKAGADWKEKRMWTDEDMLKIAGATVSICNTLLSDRIVSVLIILIDMLV